MKFHDGSPLDAATVAAIFPESLRTSQLAVWNEVESIRATDPNTVEILLKAPSPFFLEALEADIQKRGKTPIGTGPFVVPQDATELRANKNYYLNPPSIERITVGNYPNVRVAWAEMLRNNLDMLWEVGPDALDSLKGSSTTSTFSYTRHYQHVMVMNTSAPVFRSKEIRRALNLAVDRQAFVKNALNGYGVVSSAPVSVRHWALAGRSPTFAYDPQAASEALSREHPGGPLRFTALVAPNSLDERIALELKRQFAALGVDMKVEEASRDQLVQRCGTGNYDAAVLYLIEGPTIIRDYIVWRSGMETNWGHWGNAAVDAALDRARAAANDEQYRQAIVDMQQTFIDDPPAVFLAWSVQARAVNKRFVVPAVEPDRDIIGTMHLWRPASHNQSPPPGQRN